MFKNKKLKTIAIAIFATGIAYTTASFSEDILQKSDALPVVEQVHAFDPADFTDPCADTTTPTQRVNCIETIVADQSEHGIIAGFVTVSKMMRPNETILIKIPVYEHSFETASVQIQRDGNVSNDAPIPQSTTVR